MKSFPRLPLPIYFLFTFYCSHGFTTSLIGLPQPIYFLFAFIILVGLLVIILAILVCWACFTIFSSHLLHIVGLLLLLSHLSKVGINNYYLIDQSNLFLLLYPLQAKLDIQTKCNSLKKNHYLLKLDQIYERPKPKPYDPSLNSPPTCTLKAKGFDPPQTHEYQSLKVDRSLKV